MADGPVTTDSGRTRRSRVVLSIGVAVSLVGPLPSLLAAGEGVEVPVLSEELAAGATATVPAAPVAPVAKIVDGDDADWVGTPTGFGGTAVVSAGEFVYQDHVFDAWGADDGGDAERLAVLDAAAAVEPRLTKVEALIAQDPPSQVGAPTPDAVRGSENYGDAGLLDVTDLVEVRLDADADEIFLLARTTTMTGSGDVALLVLLADGSTSDPVPVPFGSGLTTTARFAALLDASGGTLVDLGTGSATSFPVAFDPSGWDNTVEAAIPFDGPSVSVAVAAATPSAAGVGTIGNVAFRFDEPVRTFFDRSQALALHAGSIDEFLAPVPLAVLRSGAGTTQRLVPGAGYHDRVFRSTDRISDERSMDGVWQHYGLYLPDSWDAGAALPLQWWLHWRGGHAHSAASIIPRMFRTLGDGEAASPVTGIGDSLVVAPRGRGTSTWYVGIGHADFLEVWDDVHSLLGGRVDRSREYVTGHSMGGWGSYLMSVLYPDRFAAAFPYSGPVTQGAWTGLDFPGCDSFRWTDYTPCYIEANSGRARDQHTRRLLENLRNVPIGIFHGAADELVPTSGVTRQVEQLAVLGLPHRYYLFPAYEHFSFPVADEWTEGGRYAHRFSVPEHPRRVSYVRDVAFERATEQVQAKGRTFDWSFDSAYWMSGLGVAPGAAAARFDGQSLAVAPERPIVPTAGGPTAPGQSGPYVMEGLRRLDEVVLPATTSNGFTATLTGASSVQLDLAAMLVDSAEVVSGTVTTGTPLTLRLSGYAASPAAVTCNGTPVAAGVTGDVLRVDLPAGSCSLVVTP